MISTVLVANRGAVASRIFRSARRAGLRTVAVYSDADCGEPFVDEADRAVSLRGVRAEDTYLSIDKVLDACERAGADAVHPGYGFLAENAFFAAACAEAGIVFIGPPVEVIDIMGSKTRAKALAAAAGVPVLPAFTVGVDDEGWAAAAATLGFPLLIKPSAGGGGKGMLQVDDPDALAESVAAARRVSFAAFGDATLLLERFVTRGRHVEVQIVADGFGNVIHLGERECSIQRRHQKVIEESPSTAVDTELRARLTSAAVALARSIRYESVGTVEFLLEPSGDFWFLEANTRLQVEHAVTEERTGLDLVALQMHVASGRPLPMEQKDVVFTGHAVQARLYAERPADGFLPAPGRVAVADFPSDSAIRVESGIKAGSEVGTHYDPMLAKLIASAPDRGMAVARLADALRRTDVRGVDTNRDFLVRVLGSEDFVRGETFTSFIADHPQLCDGADDSELLCFLATSVAIADAYLSRAGGAVPCGLPAGWRNVTAPPQAIVLRANGSDVSIGVRRVGADDWRIFTAGGEVDARCTDVTVTEQDARFGLELAGVRRHCRVLRCDETWWVHTRDGGSSFLDVRAAAELANFDLDVGASSPMPGTVILVPVAVGDEVHAGDVLAVIEAMKMEHRLLAAADGVVSEVRVAPGDSVGAHQVLVVVDEHAAALAAAVVEHDVMGEPR